MTPDKPIAKQLAIRDIPSLVYDAVNLEGVNMTLPEVQTILDGISVGGHKISDQNMALNQAKTWKHLFALVDQNKFSFTKTIALQLHAVAAKHVVAAKEEALQWGNFRTGNVSISGCDYEPPAPDKLDSIWQAIETELEGFEDIYEKAICAFLRMARAQFFWDVNKRMGRFMMNGILLDFGMPIINVQAKYQKQFNELMLAFYVNGDMEPMILFLRGCLNTRIISNFKKTETSN